MRICSHVCRIALASALLLDLATPVAHAQCEEQTESWERVEINLGSGVAAPIVENAGHLADDDAFGALSAAGTAARFGANGRVDIVISLETDFARAGFEPVDTDGPAILAPTEPLWGTVVYYGPGSPGELAAWGALRVAGLYGGATLEYRMTGRTWRMRLTGEAGDLGRLALRPTGVVELTGDELASLCGRPASSSSPATSTPGR